jgi:hypothetical protein
MIAAVALSYLLQDVNRDNSMNSLAVIKVVKGTKVKYYTNPTRVREYFETWIALAIAKCSREKVMEIKNLQRQRKYVILLSLLAAFLIYLSIFFITHVVTKEGIKPWSTNVVDHIK